jgi:hypothetical protein
LGHRKIKHRTDLVVFLHNPYNHQFLDDHHPAVNWQQPLIAFLSLLQLPPQPTQSPTHTFPKIIKIAGAPVSDLSQQLRVRWSWPPGRYKQTFTNHCQKAPTHPPTKGNQTNHPRKNIPIALASHHHRKQPLPCVRMLIQVQPPRSGWHHSYSRGRCWSWYLGNHRVGMMAVTIAEASSRCQD